MEQKDICSICSASKTCKVKYFQLEDAIRPPDDLHFDGLTELNGVLGNILNIKGKDRKATNEICQKCRDKLHGIYSFTHQHTRAEKISHQITDVTVRLKKLKTLFLLTNDRKKEFGAIAESDKECSSTVCDNPVVSGVVVKMECDNNFEGVDFNKAIKDQNVKYSSAADSRSVEQKKIDSMNIKDRKVANEICQKCRDKLYGIYSFTHQHTRAEKIFHQITDVTVRLKKLKILFISTNDLKKEFEAIAESDKDGDSPECSSTVCDSPAVFGKVVKMGCDDNFEGVDFNEAIKAKNVKYSNAADSRSVEQKKIDSIARENAEQITDERFATVPCFKDHTKNVHEIDSSGFNEGDAEQLEGHIQVFSTKNELGCDQCEAKYKTKFGLRQHKLVSHSTVLPAYKCDYCNAKFYVKSNFTRHRRYGESLKCPQCNVIYCTKPKLWMHLKTVHSITNFCDQCGKEFKTKQDLKEHKLSHTDVTFTCNQCDASFYKRRYLTAHLRGVHTVAVFCCGQCDAICKSEQDLNDHKLNHSRISYNCDKCERSFSKGQSLKYHKRYHHINAN